MGVYDELSEDDQRAVSQLSRYLIETEGNRFYDQKLVAVRNHIAGNVQLIEEARAFQKKFAALMAQQAQALTSIGKRLETASSDPVKDMMRRYENPETQAAFMEKVDGLLKTRGKKKKKFLIF